MFRQSSILLSLCLLSPIASAEVKTHDAGKWKIADELNNDLNVASCRAYTTASKPAGAELSLHFPKDPKALPYVTVKTRNAGVNSDLLALRISSRESQYFFRWKTGTDNATPDTFWYVPVDQRDLISLIRERDTLELVLDPKGAKAPLKFSLSGSSAVLDQARKCLGKNFPTADDFLKILVKEKDNLSPELGDRSVDLLFRSTQEAYAAYRLGQDYRARLDLIKKQFAPQVKAEAAALAARNAAQVQVDQNIAAIEQTKAEIASAEAKLPSLQSNLDSLVNARPALQQTLDQKSAIYNPLREQVQPFLNRRDRAESRYNELAREVRRNENVVSEGENKVGALERERSELDSSIWRSQSKVNELERDLGTADSDLNRFSVPEEARRILQNDWQYSNLQEQRRQKNQQLHEARRNEEQAERRLQDLQRQLNECNSRQGANCADVQNQVNTATWDLSSKRSSTQSLDRECAQLEILIRGQEDSARNQAERKRDELKRKRDEISDQLRNAENELDRSRNRLGQVQFELQSTKADVDRARTALPGLRRDRDNASDEYDRANDEYQAKAKTIGYDVAEKEYLAAKSAVDDLDSRISSLRWEISFQQRIIAGGNDKVTALEQELENLRTGLATAEQRLAAAQAAAKPYHEEASSLEEGLTREGARFKNNRALFQQLYVILAETLH